jgi:hypothetical protein
MPAPRKLAAEVRERMRARLMVIVNELRGDAITLQAAYGPASAQVVSVRQSITWLLRLHTQLEHETAADVGEEIFGRVDENGVQS